MRVKSIIGIIMIISGSVIMVGGYEKYSNYVCHCTDITTGGISTGVPPYCYDCDAEQPLIGHIMFYTGIIVMAGGFILFVSSRISEK